jgi:hypothetical protein
MKQKTLAFALIASVLMSACGSAAKAPAAATTVLPAATPIPPTATPAPKPVAVSNGDGAQSVTQVLTEAISKTRVAKSYSETITLTSKGAVMGMPGEASENEETVLMNQTSRFDGANRSTEISGMMTKKMGASTSIGSLVMSGLPDGKSVVVPGVKIDAKKTHINIRVKAP